MNITNLVQHKNDQVTTTINCPDCGEKETVILFPKHFGNESFTHVMKADFTCCGGKKRNRGEVRFKFVHTVEDVMES